MSIPIWQRGIGFLMYMLPWSDALGFGGYLFKDFQFLQLLAIPAIPIVLIEQIIPFGSLILFLGLFLAVVRNPKVPYFLRFNTLQALLIDIALFVITLTFQIILKPIGESFIVSTLSSTVLVGTLAIIIFVFVKCIQGEEPDLPGISEAVRVQL